MFVYKLKEDKINIYCSLEEINLFLKIILFLKNVASFFWDTLNKIIVNCTLKFYFRFKHYLKACIYIWQGTSYKYIITLMVKTD